MSNQENNIESDKLLLSLLYTKFISSSNPKHYSYLLKNNPKKFYNLIKSNHNNIQSLSKENQTKIFHLVCEMIKSLNPERISLGLDILREIVQFIPSNLLENSFTYSKTLEKNTNGIFSYSLEETKEVKIKSIKLISDFKDLFHSEKHFDFIIELINDEEDEVRFEAVDCLSDLLSKIDKCSFQICEILLFALKEKSTKLRRKYYLLLGKMKIELNEKQFVNVISILQDNLKHFRNDRNHIFKCVKSFSENNCFFLNEQYFIELFNLDENFFKQEFNWDDDLYIINMIVFQEYIYLNMKNIKMRIPKFFLQHFYFFEEKYPLLFNRNISKCMTDNLNMEIETNDINLNVEKIKCLTIKEIDSILSNIIYNENEEKYIMYKKNIGLIYRIITKRIIDNNIIITEEIIKIIKKIIYLIEFQSYLENEDNSTKTIRIINEKILDKLNEKSIIIDEKEINNLLLKSEIDNRTFINLQLLHPEKEQLYPDLNRKYKIYPFTFPIQIKIMNLQNIKTNAKIYLMKHLKLTLIICDKNNPYPIDISFLPSNGSIFSQIETRISMKKKQNIFIDNNNYYQKKTEECLLIIQILTSSNSLIKIRKIPFFIIN